MNLIQLALIGLFISGVAWADRPICDDLDQATCWPGSRSDVTGVAFSATDANDRLVKIELASRAELKEDISAFIGQPESGYLRDLVRAHLNLNEQTCAQNPTACNQALAEGLYEFMRRGLFPGSPPILQDAHKLENVAAIEENKRYIEFFKRMTVKLRPRLIDPDLENRIKTQMFPMVKCMLLNRINELDIPEDVRGKMVRKISAVEFAGIDCATTPTQNGFLIVPNSFYNRNKNQVQICEGMLYQTTSEFPIVFHIAHEIMHSVDPCNIAADDGSLFKYILNDPAKSIDSQYPVKNLVTCLRGPDALNAKPALPEAEATSFSAKVCSESDQIGEAIGDWMGAEILPRYMNQKYRCPNIPMPKLEPLSPEQFRKGYQNVFAWYCRKNDADQTPEHPSDADRANRVLLTNPMVRTEMSCAGKPKFLYCAGSGTAEADASTSKNPEARK